MLRNISFWHASSFAAENRKSTFLVQKLRRFAITRTKDAKDFPECKDAAKADGEVAGNALKDAEKKIGKRIVTDENFLDQSEKQKRLEQKKGR